MMTLASRGRGAREGTRMGLWGAAQAIAFGMGGMLGTALVDLAQWVTGPSGSGLAYAFVFGLEALGFVVAHWLAVKTTFSEHGDRRPERTRSVLRPRAYLPEVIESARSGA